MTFADFEKQIRADLGLWPGGFDANVRAGSVDGPRRLWSVSSKAEDA